MAAEYQLLMRDKRLTEEMLVKKINMLGYSCDEIEQLPRGIGIGLYEEAGFMVYLSDKAEHPFNGQEAQGELVDREFTAQKSLDFRMDGSYPDFDKPYFDMFRIVFDLTGELNEEALFISNYNSELFLFRTDKTILVNRNNESWFRKNVLGFVGDRTVLYV